MTGNGQTSYIPREELLVESIHEHLDTHNDTAITLDELRHLVFLIDQSDMAELEVKRGEGKARLLLRKAKPGEGIPLQASAESPLLMEENTQAIKHTTITASQVGTFQRWARSKDAPFIKVGDMIQAGQHIGAIRSLNIPNEVESTVAGRVVEILVEDGQAIEYGQPLITIEQQ